MNEQGEAGAANAVETSRSPAYQIYLSSRTENPFRGVTGRLVRVFGLDVYGTSLLHRRGILELRFVSVLLLVIFVFDAGTWSLLFNSMLHASANIFARDWLTPFAVTGALLVATAVIIFERQFFCADVTTHWIRSFMAFVVRLAVIAASAFVTAQPVELLTFHGPIARRAHEEAVLREVVARETQVKDEETKAEKAQAEKANAARTVMSDTNAGRELQAGQDATSEAQKRANQAAAAASRSANAVTSLQHEVMRSQSVVDQRQSELEQQRRNGGETTSAEEALSAARRARSYARSSLESARQQAAGDRETGDKAAHDAETRRGAEKELRKRRDEVEEKIRQQHQADADLAEKRRNDLRAYVDEVRKSGLTHDVVSNVAHEGAGAPQPFRYHFEPGDVFAQLEILEDLKRGRPARWPALDSDTRSKLAQTYAVDDPARGTPDELARRADSAALYRRAYWIAFVIAIVIPVLVMATKLLLTGELAAYYSLRRQADAGNPEAIAVVRTMPRPRSFAERLAAFLALVKSVGQRPQPS